MQKNPLSIIIFYGYASDYYHVMEQLLVENQHETTTEEAHLRRRICNEDNSHHDDSTGNGEADNVDDNDVEEESHLRAKEKYPCRKVIHDSDIPPNVGPPKA